MTKTIDHAATVLRYAGNAQGFSSPELIHLTPTVRKTVTSMACRMVADGRLFRFAVTGKNVRFFASRTDRDAYAAKHADTSRASRPPPRIGKVRPTAADAAPAVQRAVVRPTAAHVVAVPPGVTVQVCPSPAPRYQAARPIYAPRVYG